MCSAGARQDLSQQAGGLPRSAALGSLVRVVRGGFLSAVSHDWARLGDTYELRLGPRRLVVAVHPDDVAHVTVTNRAAYDKRASYATVRRYLTGQGLVASTGPVWRRQRKLMAPMFTPRSIQAYASVFVEEGDRLAKRWESLAGQGTLVDIGEEMMRVTAAIILRTMFSARSDDEIVSLRGDVETMIGFATDQQMGLPRPDWLPTRARSSYQAARGRVYDYITGVIEQRRCVPEDQWPPDLLTRLMMGRDDDGQPMSDELLRDESITIFFAGHETTARSLAATWHALDRHPHVASRLHTELDTVLANRDPSVDDLPSLPYTLQVVKETLRLFPPAPVYVRDAIEDDIVGGYPVPAGTAVMLAPYLTHRHPDFWADPEQFDPDRWTPEAEAARHTAAYHPFALGHRVCIGNHFSLLESHLLLAQLARRFTAHHDPDFTPTWTMKGVLTPTPGLLMRIHQR